MAIKIELNITNPAKLKEYFFKIHPIPQVDILDDDDIPTGEKEDKYSDMVWFKIELLNYIKRDCKKGKRKIAERAGEALEEIIE